MSSQSYLINQPMPLERRQMPAPTSHQSTDHRRRHSEEDKVDGNMPNETVADCATAASTNNTTKSKGLNLTTSSSFADKKQIAALMASTATFATEASSVAPSIETTFIAAAAATAQNSTGRLDKHLGDSIASLSLSDLDFAEQLDADNTQDALDSTNQAQQDNKCDEDETYDSLSETSNITRKHNGIDIENRFLRPRIKELHHYALAIDIVCDLDDEDTDSSDDDTISELSNRDGSTDKVRGFQAEDDECDDDEELFLSSLKEGLKFMHRARKSEKHIFALAAFLLDDSDDENDES